MSTKPPELSVVTEPVRLAFPSLFEPRSFEGSDPRYEATILLPPDFDLGPIKRAIITAMEHEWGKAQRLSGNSNPIRACETKTDLQGYDPGWKFINLKTKYAPVVVSRDPSRPILTAQDIPAGCWVRVKMNAFAWTNAKGGRGVSFNFDAVQFVRDDEHFGSAGVDATEIFDTIDFDGEDELAPGGDSTEFLD